jgi:hypothetical protein
VTGTKFDTVRGVRGGVGAWACPVESNAHSKAALSSDNVTGHLIAPSLNVKNGGPAGPEILAQGAMGLKK